MNSITPINSLAGSMDKYLDKLSGNEEIVSKAKHSLDVMARRSKSLMNFVDRYRMISTVPLPQRKPVDLKKLITDVLLLMENELQGVDVRITGAPVIVNGDSSLLEQVIINLIKNSLQAMNNVVEKQIRIETQVNEKFARIRISDNGKGILPTVIDKIFIPFFTTRDDGSGIGLTLSRQIMHRHGGGIEVQSREGQGSVFTLSLPVEIF